VLGGKKMTAQEYVQMYIGKLVLDVAVLQAKVDELNNKPNKMENVDDK
jgi:hypothetical protein